jgi:hypothetical protein
MGSFILLTLAACEGDSGQKPSFLQLATSCADPAPINGLQPDRQAPYIVLVKPGVDATAESARLGAQYAFDVSSVFLFGFEAELSSGTVEQLACEATVESIHYDDGTFGVM